MSGYEKYLIIKLAATLAVFSLFATPVVGKLWDRFRAGAR